MKEKKERHRDANSKGGVGSNESTACAASASLYAQGVRRREEGFSREKERCRDESRQ